VAAPDELPGQTSSGSSQRDLEWLRSATAEEIDQALAAGELNRLLGQPTRVRTA
jgi:hypothetical protein